MSQTSSFTGFASPNTTPVPDQLFDELLTVLSGNELKVLLYIIRRTFGFKKRSDTISLNQMLHGLKRKNGTVLDRGVGLSKPTLLNALKALFVKGIILRERRASTRRGNLPTCYALNMAAEAKKPKIKLQAEPEMRVGESHTPLGQNSLPSLGQTLLPTTRNSQTRYKNNVVKKHRNLKKSEKPKAQIDYLVDEIERHTGDTHSRGNFAQIATILADHKIFQLLSEMKHDPTIRNRGAWFTALANQRSKPPPTEGSG